MAVQTQCCLEGDENDPVNKSRHNSSTKLVRVMTVGEGDLSYSLALKRAFGDAVDIVATTYLLRDELLVRYRSVASRLDELEKAGVTVMHGIDACTLNRSQVADLSFDAIVFNYPHLGDSSEGISPESAHCGAHQSLLAHFLASACKLLTAPNGQIHVTLCGNQPELWKLRYFAEHVGLRELQCLAPSDVSAFCVPSCLLEKPAITDEHKHWMAGRKWRNGSYGPMHWAARYGYEYRRHDSEQMMDVAGSLAFVFEKNASASPAMVSDDVAYESHLVKCRVCERVFEDQDALDAHCLAPAQPMATANIKSWGCEFCSRRFNSERSLQQHMNGKSCLKASSEIEQQKQATSTPECFPADAMREASAVVVASDAGARLGKYAQLCAFPKLLPSKARARRAIASGELTLNGQIVEDSRILAAGDTLRLRLNVARDEREASVGMAKNVRVVAMPDGQGYSCDTDTSCWQVTASECPRDVAVVWKPCGMRSRGEHAGTLQTSIATLSVFAGSNCRPMPMTRLEIGCSGLAVIALTPEADRNLSRLMRDGCVTHTFRATTFGRVADPGCEFLLQLPCSAPDTQEEVEVADEAEGKFVTTSLPSGLEASRVVSCSVLEVQGDAPVEKSVVELEVAAENGRCCGLLCHMLRERGTPVLGDRYARRVLQSIGKENRRGLQIECVRVRLSEASSPIDGFRLDVRICRERPTALSE